MPDLSEKTDEELKRGLQGGITEFTLGCALQALSDYTPRISTSKSHRYDSDFLSPKTINGIGTVIIIDGAKEVFWDIKELYKRIREHSTVLNKGLMDLSFATCIYLTSSYAHIILGSSFSEFGGEVALFATYSLLATRGIYDTCTGLKEMAQQADTSVLSRYLWGWGRLSIASLSATKSKKTKLLNR
ncbi:MAG TPA: hypothetical protein DD412_05585 [Holosporales bacterium]|nr:hypothetical protein [Holosporales bacterium]